MILTKTPLESPLAAAVRFIGFLSATWRFLFSVAIDKYMYFAINRPIIDSLVRIKYSRTEIVENVAQLQHQLARAAS